MGVGTCDALSRAGHAVGLVYHDDRPAPVDCPTFQVSENRSLAQRCGAMGAAARRRFPPFRPEVYVEWLGQAFERAIGWFAATANEGPAAR